MAEVMFRRSTICATTGQRPSKKGRLNLQTSTEHEPGALFRWAPDIGCTYPSLCRAVVIADISLLVPGKVHGCVEVPCSRIYDRMSELGE